ncbi:flagellar assembly protein FliH [Helicobacter apodemus]|uniref:Flagellar assembly protein FliH n=1 Tax=Helicobacter apodemus TaxID=135569 RepID=A0A2U8FFK5_9HELI|nr:flagellar assembly protein FliH [Helicobacter apodemus]AWI34999.1 flagellar assembly protein FliH [Helicobacter apodemus]
MNNLNEYENIIPEEHKSKHDIKKYSFRNMEIKKTPIVKEKQDIDNTPQEQTSPPQEQTNNQSIETTNLSIPSLKLFETEVVDKILQKSDVLAQSLQKLQEQFDKQEKEFDQRVNAVKLESKELGYKEGYEAAKAELEAQINSQKELYNLSIQRIDQNIAESKNHILNLEKELSAIALDIAKEIITTEVSNNSSKIAAALARTLLENVAKNTEVTLKVFPGDLEDLKESLKDLTNIVLQADQAIAKGGVVILSKEGNIDGDIHLRFATLKKSILNNKE